MNHIFVTRMAVVLGGRARITKTLNKQYDTPRDRIDDIIKYWFDVASKFYTQQTVDQSFKVYVVYSQCYEDVVRSYTYPEWCVLTCDKSIDKMRNVGDFKEYNDMPLSLSRVDADDWYSNDYFEYMSATPGDEYLTTHLHKRIRLYNRNTNKISTPQRFSSPGFASITFPKFNVNRLPTNLPLWPHGNIKRRQHFTPNKIYCVQSVGCNVVNKWRRSAKIETDKSDLDRYYIPI